MGRNYTIRYEEYIYEKVKTSTFEQVRKTEQLTAEQVTGIFKRMNNKKTENNQN